MDNKKERCLLIIVCLVLLIPMSTVGVFLTYIVDGLIGNLPIGYIISFLIVGCVAALPILIKVDVERKMSIQKRFFIRVGIVILFAVLAFGVMIVSTVVNQIYRQRQFGYLGSID